MIKAIFKPLYMWPFVCSRYYSLLLTQSSMKYPLLSRPAGQLTRILDIYANEQQLTTGLKVSIAIHIDERRTKTIHTDLYIIKILNIVWLRRFHSHTGDCYDNVTVVIRLTLTTTDNEETFLLDFLKILKRRLQNL